MSSSQKTLFGSVNLNTPIKPPLARRTDPESSHIAAAKVPEFEATHEGRILALLWKLPPDKDMTTAEMAKALEWRREIPARRMKGLVTKGKVEIMPLRLCAACGSKTVAYRAKR